MEFLGSIPKRSTRQASLTNASPAGRFEFELRRICRFNILQARAESILQNLAVDHLDRSPADYAFEHFYPLLALSHESFPHEPFQPHNINRHALVEDPVGVLLLCQQRRGFQSNRSTHLRRRIANLYPKRVWVPAEWKLHLRFLSYHMFDYQDRLLDDQRENNRKRKALGTLINLMDDSPTRPSVATETDPPPETRSVSTATEDRAGPSHEVKPEVNETDDRSSESRRSPTPIYLE